MPRSRRPAAARQAARAGVSRALAPATRSCSVVMLRHPVAARCWSSSGCPTLASIGLSFTGWDGIGGTGRSTGSGSATTSRSSPIYPPFWPAVRHNLLWLASSSPASPTPFGLLPRRPARQGDPVHAGFYQSALYLPVVLSLAIVGFIAQLVYSQDQGLINGVLGTTRTSRRDWLGDPDLNLWAVLVAAGWRHVGYVMILYLAGLKSVDPSLQGGRRDRRRERVADVPPRGLPGAAAGQRRRRSSSR